MSFLANIDFSSTKLTTESPVVNELRLEFFSSTIKRADHEYTVQDKNAGFENKLGIVSQFHQTCFKGDRRFPYRGSEATFSTLFPHFKNESDYSDDNTYYVVDLTKVPFDEIIVPSREKAHLYCTSLLPQVRQSICDATNASMKLRFPQLSDELQKLTCRATDIRTYFPAIMLLGQQLCLTLEPNILKTLINKHQTCELVRFHDHRYCEHPEEQLLNNKSKLINAYILEQQSFVMPSLEEWMKGDTIKCHHSILKTLTILLRESGIKDANPRVFLNGLPSIVANEIAKTWLFIEDPQTSPFLHGKFSHLIQVLGLSLSDKLDKLKLEQIVTNDLWNHLFDNEVASDDTSQVEINSSVNGQKSITIFHGVADCLTGLCPDTIQRMILEKDFSRAAYNILCSNDPKRKTEFLSICGIASNSTEQLDVFLKDMCVYATVMEACMINSAYKGRHKAGHQHLPLEKISLTNFNLGTKGMDAAVCARAKQYLQKGHIVKVVVTQYLWRREDLILKRVIKDEKDIDLCLEKSRSGWKQYIGFIIEPKLKF
ncbi:hypothetical protein D5R81_12840 [Parashewanella spongiae]|uniref:Uncharacterized protein n=1 Tax=Parashewanella spongiae TaxID=342950 RepID=A0A3A6U332_9GAMM|nr:hypothetical protein [Parashewanella spongiae]MCL1078817.1 hypothetical protein [Parashewanella spongiae]RJY11904.1 hypothetical protein D5R81_12840 [Parashewanella spongiae]